MAKPAVGSQNAQPSQGLRPLPASLKNHPTMKSLFFIFFSCLILISCATKVTGNHKIELEKELGEMAEIDQIAAYIPQGKYKEYTQQQWAKFKDSVFTNNKKKSEGYFNKYGFLGFDKVGKEGSYHFWQVVQHCDKYPEFQDKVLKVMDKEVKKGNANPINYAYLYDRVKLSKGEKQRFGTQVIYEIKTTGRALVKNGLIDSVNIDKIRKEYNLGTLKEYLNQQTISHFEMNKQHYTELGIIKPNLY